VSDDSPAWEIAKLALSAALGGTVATLLQQLLPRIRLTVALRADARGALRTAASITPRVSAAAETAARIEAMLSAGETVSFEELTKLPGGWIVTAPRPDLLANAERFDETEASAVMKYLHYWNTVAIFEERYRTALEEFLKLFAVPTSASGTGAVVLRERISRVRDNARALVRAAQTLRAQAECFQNGEIRELTPTEEESAEKRLVS
jgi:hypothetical protein